MAVPGRTNAPQMNLGSAGENMPRSLQYTLIVMFVVMSAVALVLAVQVSSLKSDRESMWDSLELSQLRFAAADFAANVAQYGRQNNRFPTDAVAVGEAAAVRDGRWAPWVHVNPAPTMVHPDYVRYRRVADGVSDVAVVSVMFGGRSMDSYIMSIPKK